MERKFLSNDEEIQIQREKSPELQASLWSLLTWHWLQPFVLLGNQKTLQDEDLYELNPNERAEHCEELWMNAIEKAKQKSNENATQVWKSLWNCFGREYAKAALFKPLWLVGAILQVYIMRALVNVVADENNFEWWWGTLLVLGMFSMSALVSISQHMCIALGQKVGMKLRSTVSMAVYNKLLRMKLVSLLGTNSGLMLNLITNDTQKLLDAAAYFNFAWFALIEIGIVSTLALKEIGVSAIPGVIIALLSQPISVWMARVKARLRANAVKYTDARAHLTGEILNGIRVIKYNGWIAPFLHQIAGVRHNEIFSIKRASYVRASTSTLRELVTPIASLATFGTYVAIHKEHFMPPSQAFTVLALFSVLVRIFSLAPAGVQASGESIVAMRRFQKLLDLDKLNEFEKEDIHVSKDLSDNAVVALDCSFSWQQKVKKNLSSEAFREIGGMHIEKVTNIRNPNLELKKSSIFDDVSNEDAVLKTINFSVGKGELVCIYGSVGSGKSSLMLGMLGEMQCLKGKFYVQHNIAYVPQQPWILNDTFWRNIVFTNPFDPERYHRSIIASALEQDISEFAQGHDTEIGERGINLSGGQKARISLARACYSSAPVVFLDDPFAAVDVPTAKHLIEHVLNGILKGRTVMLVTHNKTALAVCDRVYSIKNGCLHLHEELTKSNIMGKSTEVVQIATNQESFPHEKVSTISHNADSTISHNADSNQLEDYNINGLDTSQTMQPGTIDSVGDKAKGKATVKEDRIEGNIKMSTWIAYGKAAGLSFCFFVILVFMVGQAVRVMLSYWLGVWTDKKYQLKQGIYLTTYASFTITATILIFSRALLFTHATITAAAEIHNQMAERVLRSPQLFFDQNTAGRILNRFTKDQALVDEVLPDAAQQVLDYAIASLGGLIFIGVLIPWFLLAFPPLFLVFYYVQQCYVVISRELKRLEAISRSPIYAHFTQTLQGIASIRAYETQSKMREIFRSLIDANHRSFILFLHLSRWLGIRLDFATCMCVSVACTLVILLRSSISPGLAGVILTQSMQVTGFLQFAVKQAAETENYFTSVERINVYANLPSEADPTTPSGIIETRWPSRGEIEFSKYTLTYRVDLPPVLNAISFKIHAMEKIGILGRTGVGKSSLAAALFRIVENKKCTGDIFIDGVNIKCVGLDDLRQRLSIVPQDPILFQGSLRFNLDPFEVHSDTEIFEALSRVHLTEKIQSLERGLDCNIAQNGENFSVGQRQLICLARALLRRSHVIVMDEATAAVDMETDKLIQTTIRTVFRDCTVLTIAHRIDTVIDCDRVLILVAGGHIAEFDSPSKLLSCHDQGIFAEMVRQTGPAISNRLREAACEAERLRKEHVAEENLHASEAAAMENS